MSILLFLLLSTGCGWLLYALIRRVRRARLRSAALLFVLLGSVPGVVLLGALSAHLANNWHLHRFAAQLFEYPLPTGAAEVSRRADVGVLTGNGDHCDFIARREIRATLPLEAVRTHFEPLALRPAIGRGASGGPPALEIERQREGLYVVTAVDAAYYGSFDLRCY